MPSKLAADAQEEKPGRNKAWKVPVAKTLGKHYLVDNKVQDTGHSFT